MAFLCRLVGIREVVGRCGPLVGTSNFSSLSHALRRASGVKFIRALIAALEEDTQYQRGELVVLDSMAVTFGKTRRHNCKKFNNRAVGGGVLWAFRIKARAGTCPVRLIKTMRGAWNDANLMSGVKLAARNAIYLMDRGFYCIDRIREWLEQEVRFIVRVKAKNLMYDLIEHLSPARNLEGGWRLELDALVYLGSPNRRTPRPKVRLIIAIPPGGEQFIYATSQTRASAWQIIKDYKQRWHIERFHRFLKDNLGLAHVYSFDADGLEFLILTALLTAMLLFTTADPCDERQTIRLLYAALTQARKQLEVPSVWRRNILAVKRSAGRKKAAAIKCTNL